jgi:hypothetical protein
MLSSDEQFFLNSQLKSQEKIISVTRPVAKALAWQTLSIWIFGLPWTGFTLFWCHGFFNQLIEKNESTGPFIFGALLGGLFLLIGMFMIFSPYLAYKAAKKTFYVATNQRLIFAKGKKLESVFPKEIKGFSTRATSFATKEIVLPKQFRETAKNVRIEDRPRRLSGLTDISEFESALDLLASLEQGAVETRQSKYESFKNNNELNRSGTTVHGWSSIILGTLFFSIGLFIGLMALDVIQTPESQFGAPRWVVAIAGAIFALPGLALVIHGLMGIVRQKKLQHNRQLHPGEHWMWDYPWSSKETYDNSKRKIFSSLMGFIFLAIFMTPFNYLILNWLKKSYVALIGVLFIGLFDLILITLFYNTLKQIITYALYGRSKLTFRRFPFFLGDKFIGVINGGFIIAETAIKCELRCIQEQFTTTYERDGDRPTNIDRKILYSDSKDLQISPMNNRIEIEFKLPTDPALSSELSSHPPRYWELEIKGATLQTTFLVPIYSRLNSSRE